MARRFHLSFPILLALACAASAQTTTAPALNPAPSPAASVTLGQSAVHLYGPWKFSVGDSPLDPATHQPLWAQPAFDDSHWEAVDLTPQQGANDPITGLSGYVPGWTAKGHAGYWGYAWYRIRIRLDAQPGQRLALAGPYNVDDVYQAFANGTLLGSFGDFSTNPPSAYYTQPTMFMLPEPALSGIVAPTSSAAPTQPAQTLVIAFRVWMEPNTLISSPTVGGLHSAPIFGDAAAVIAGYQSQWLQVTRTYASTPIQAIVFLLLAIGAFVLIFFDPSDRVYLWIGAVFLTSFAVSVVTSLVAWTHVLGIVSSSVLTDVIFSPLTYAGWVMVWWIWFDLRRPAWLPRATAAMALLLALANLLGEDLWFTVIPHPVSHAIYIVSIAVRLCFIAILFWIAYLGIRLHGLEGWLALPPVLLFGLSRFATDLTTIGIVLFWFPFGIQFSLGVLASLLMAVVLTLLLLRRLILSLRKQRQMALDVKQAQEVQQVILPQERMTLPGLEIESEYRPALEVGGDFFQIIPDPVDGSLLIVAGDVAGKGLKAGMLVALLVGGIRSAVDWSADPALVLRALNRRLLGRGDAQATCLALRIEPTGAVTLVNAGHLPPYLNGMPLDIEGALPLGISSNNEFSITRFTLDQGDTLVLISDGVVEATDSNGQLYGFERTAQLMQSASSAAEIAAAAQRFGQHDDISVIAVRRVPVLAAAEPRPRSPINIAIRTRIIPPNPPDGL